MNFLRTRWAQLAGLTALLGGIGIYSLREKYCVTDFDTWWHLKVGDWIIRNSTLPHTGILSRTAADRAWVAYSWGYEILLSLAYSWFGLVGIGALGTILTVGVAFSIYWMLRRISGGFWLPCVLTGITCAAFLFSGGAPAGFLLLHFLLRHACTAVRGAANGAVQSLYWLPFVFVLWANLHIQFIYGLFAVGLFVAVHLSQQILAKFGFSPDFLTRSTLPGKPLAVIFAFCVLGTFLGPNSYHPYLVVLAYSKAKFTYSVIVELQPLPFRLLSNFIELFLGAAGFYAIRFAEEA